MTNDNRPPHDLTESQLIHAALLETMLQRAQEAVAAAGDDTAVQAACDRLVDDLDWLARVGGVK